MNADRPAGSAVSRLLAAYRGKLDQMPLGELAHRVGEWNCKPHETQVLALTGQPSREELINELVGRRELEIARLTPLEIDDLMDEEVI